MTKNISPIRQPNNGPRRFSTALVATVCCVGLFAAAPIVLVLWHVSLPVVGADSIASADRKLEQGKRADTPNSRLVKLNENEVNSILHDRLTRSGKLTSDSEGLHDLRIRLSGEQIEIFLVLGHRGAEITVDLNGKLYSQEGLVHFDPVAGRIGALRLPQGALVSAMHQAMSSPEESQKLLLPPNIADLRVQNSQVLLRYN